MKRLLVINPNTTEAITRRLAEAGRALLPADVEIAAQTGRFGARYISDEASFAIAGHAALDAFAPWRGRADAVLLACFGDPGLTALKEVAGVPVLGLAEASFAAGAAGGRRFAVVTGGVRWRPMLERLARELGFDASLAGVSPVALTGGEIAQNPDGAVEILAEACRTAAGETGAEAVVLGGAGLVGLKARVQPLVEVPLICSVEAGFRGAAALLETGVAPAGPRHLPAESVGLSPELAAALAGREG